MTFLMLQVSTYYVREAFNHDKDNNTLKAMPGLTASHLDPNGFEKMRVSLAFQLFGDRVLRGLHHYKDIIESSYGKGALDGTELFFRLVLTVCACDSKGYLAFHLCLIN